MTDPRFSFGRRALLAAAALAPFASSAVARAAVPDLSVLKDMTAGV
ncbi:MAG: hypothetical protein JWM94_604, partial [Sphingomonas bacterium]|nr:hypothetical protein [Sphingomonas bacterium]